MMSFYRRVIYAEDIAVDVALAEPQQYFTCLCVWTLRAGRAGLDGLHAQPGVNSCLVRFNLNEMLD